MTEPQEQGFPPGDADVEEDTDKAPVQTDAQDLRHLTLITKHIDKLSDAGMRWLHVHMMGR